MADPKIDQIMKQIGRNVLVDLYRQIDEVLSLCESEIEKIMLLHLFKYFQKVKIKGDHNKKFHGIEFIEDEIMLCTYDYTPSEIKKFQEKIKKYNYRYEAPLYLKHIGFIVKDNRSESLPIGQNSNSTSSKLDFIFREFEIRPQYPVTIEGIDYRIDIAIILNRISFYEGKIIETRKIALECDGYDYHSSPIQKRNDDVRSRKLKKNGWKEVLRYSGKELHSINELQEIHDLFEEIVEVLYV